MFCIYIAVYSSEFMKALSMYDGTGLADLEKDFISSLANSIKKSFNYLLLDPRVTKKLPNRRNSWG
jgi:hypothetical protein